MDLRSFCKHNGLIIGQICGPEWETHFEKPFRSQWELYHWMRQFKEITEAYDFNGKAVFVGGCGSGIFEEWLFRSNIKPKRIVGMDVSSYMLQQAKKRMNGRFDSEFLSYEEGWIEDTNFANGYFDVAVYIDMLQHNLDLKQALWEGHRIAKTVIIYDANALNIVRRWNEYHSEGTKPRSFYKWQLRKLLGKVGFKKIKIKNTHCIPEFLPDKFLDFAKRLEHIFEKIPILKEMTGALFVVAE